jgi:hypothetical protein
VLRPGQEARLAARLVAFGVLGNLAERFRPIDLEDRTVLLQTRPVTAPEWREFQPIDGDGIVRGLDAGACHSYAEWFGREKLGGLACGLPSRDLLARAWRGADGRAFPWGPDWDAALPGSKNDVSPYGIEELSTEWTSSGARFGDPRLAPAFRLAIELR